MEKSYLKKKNKLMSIEGDSNMEKEKAKKRIEELRNLIEYHAKRYYDEDSPEISDFEYDMLMVELRNIEKNFPEFISQASLTQKVGRTCQKRVSRSRT